MAPGNPEDGAVVWTGSSAAGSYQSAEIADEQDNSSPPEDATGGEAETSADASVQNPD